MKFQKLDPKLAHKPWLGHKFSDGSQVVHDFRCWICGKWYNYSDKDIPNLIKNGRWDFSKARAAHCGSSHCEEWYRQHLEHKKRYEEQFANNTWEFYKMMSKKRLVS